MPARLSAALIERVLAGYPVPIADAVAGLESADSLHEQRDRIVEVFRAVLRSLAGIALAVRLQYGPGPGQVSSEVEVLLRAMRSRGLTDGQWLGLLRELLRPWKDDAASYPLPFIVDGFHGHKAPLPGLFDELLMMRKAETVAHGAAGDGADLRKVLDKRLPQLGQLLEALEPLWQAAQLAVPLATPADTSERQRAWSLMRDTPARGRWRRVDLAAGLRLPPGAAVLVDSDGAAKVALDPVVVVRRPSPDALEECFFLDSGGRKGARYVALPSMAEHVDADA